MAEKPAKAKSGKGKWIIIAIVALLVLGGGAAGAWWFLMRSKHQPSAQEMAAQREKLAHFISLEPFVTNVLSQDGNTHYLQVKIDLKTYEPTVDEEVKTMTPEIRNTILRILAAQEAAKVSTVQVREQLRQEILAAVNQILTNGGGQTAHAALAVHSGATSGPIAGVYFTAFVVQ
jgi:flagellar FliL protein